MIFVLRNIDKTGSVLEINSRGNNGGPPWFSGFVRAYQPAVPAYNLRFSIVKFWTIFVIVIELRKGRKQSFCLDHIKKDQTNPSPFSSQENEISWVYVNKFSSSGIRTHDSLTASLLPPLALIFVKSKKWKLAWNSKSTIYHQSAKRKGLRSSDCMMESCMLLAEVRVHEYWWSQ